MSGIRFVLACLVTASFALAACSGQSELSGPDPAGQKLGSDGTAGIEKKPGCPSFTEACDELGKAVYEACPERIYADPGDIALCKFYAFNDAIDAYRGCFTNDEKLKLYECAKVWYPGVEPLPDPNPEPKKRSSGARKPVDYAPSG
jgi:hypothetical protein